MARFSRQPAPPPAPSRIVIPDLEGSIVAGALHQADLVGFTLVIADPPVDLPTLRMSGRWVVAAQEPPGGSTRFRGDTVVVTLRRDGGDAAGDREPRHPRPPRLSARPAVADEAPGPLERALPARDLSREELGRDATVLRFDRGRAGR